MTHVSALEDQGWIRCNFDTGASVTVFPKELYDVEEHSDLKMRTASGEIIRGYGEATIRGVDTQDMRRKIHGEVTDVHKILVSASKVHGKGYCSWLAKGGGDIIPLSHPIYKALERA